MYKEMASEISDGMQFTEAMSEQRGNDMKKWMNLLLGILMMLTLTACAADDAPTTAATTVPPEEAVGEGTGIHHADLLSEMDRSFFSRTVECPVDPGAPEVGIYTGGVVYNFRVEYGKIDPEGLVFTPEYEVCRREQLDADTLVVISAYFPDTLPNLRVSCESAYGYEQFYLYQSGEDGSILLMDTVEAENIELGSLSVCRRQEADITGLMLITEQTVDPKGEELVLLTEGTVNNVRVEHGFVENGTFVPRKELVHLDVMYPTDCVIVHADLDTALPRLRISYEGAEGFGQYYVKQSGENGSIFLEKAY